MEIELGYPRRRGRFNGGPSGDLFVQIKVLPHDVFERDGRHLYCEAPISFIDASLGGEIKYLP